MNIAQLLLSTAARFPQNPALSNCLTSLSYGEFSYRARSLAASLIRLGLVKGDRVVLYMDNCPAFFECLLACWIAGACAVPVNAKLHVRELAFVVQDSTAKVVFTDGELIQDVFGELHGHAQLLNVDADEFGGMVAGETVEPVELGGASEAWQFYTSGTTGRPKGAMLTHGNLLAMSLAYYADIDSVDERDHHLLFAPVSHASGLYALPHLLKGSHQILFRKFDTGEVLDAVVRHSRSSLFMAPTMLNRLARSPDTARTDLSNLKTIYYGGAPMYVSDLENALRLFGPKLCQIYGQGESPNTITSLSKRAHMADGKLALPDVLGSTGVARLGQQVRVVDGDGRDAPPGEHGEIITRGACVMKGYWNNPEATAKSLRNGWLFTGDIGRLDELGNLTLVDRSKDVIISGGSNIYPREVEEVIQRHPAVKEVSVAGRANAEWGEVVVAFVSARAGMRLEAHELDALCLGNMARFKRPKLYVFLDDLPKSANGKILKSELRKLLLEPGMSGAERS